MDIKKTQESLVKNTGILAVGTLCSRIVSFFLLPLYTSALTTSDYGSVDIIQTIVSLALPIVTIQLNAAVFRFLIEEKQIDSIITSTIITESATSLFFITAVLISY